MKRVDQPFLKRGQRIRCRYTLREGVIRYVGETVVKVQWDGNSSVYLHSRDSFRRDFEEIGP